MATQRKLTVKPERTFQLARGKKRILKSQINATRTALPSAYRIFKQSISHVLAHKKLYGGIVAVYLLLSLVFVKGLGSGIDLAGTKDALNELLEDSSSQFTTTVTLFGLLVGSAATASSEVGSIYQTILLIVTSLALIWALRQSYTNVRVSAKDAFYKGMYPLVQFVLVLVVICLQLTPLVAAAGINTIVIAQGLASTLFELILWTVLMVFLAGVSLYWLTSSVFALYVVTLLKTKPLEALRAARKLVRFRRWSVLRKLLFLPFITLLLLSAIMLPTIYYATPLAEWVFFTLSMFGLLITHSYLYALYRELL